RRRARHGDPPSPGGPAARANDHDVRAECRDPRGVLSHRPGAELPASSRDARRMAHGRGRGHVQRGREIRRRVSGRGVAGGRMDPASTAQDPYPSAMSAIVIDVKAGKQLRRIPLAVDILDAELNTVWSGSVTLGDRTTVTLPEGGKYAVQVRMPSGETKTK